MFSVAKYQKKNKFGKTTYEVQIDTIFWIHIHETNNETFLVEFKERGLFKKLYFSYLSDNTFLETVSNSIDKVYITLHEKRKNTYSDEKWSREKASALRFSEMTYNSKSI